MSNADKRIVVRCNVSLGICRRDFSMAYRREDFEDMTREQIEELAYTDAFNHAVQNYLNVTVELPAELTEATNAD
jgi:hypothetical protein